MRADAYQMMILHLAPSNLVSFISFNSGAAVQGRTSISAMCLEQGRWNLGRGGGRSCREQGEFPPPPRFGQGIELFFQPGEDYAHSA